MSEHHLVEKIAELNQELNSIYELRDVYKRNLRLVLLRIAKKGGSSNASIQDNYELEEAKAGITQCNRDISELESQLKNLTPQPDPLQSLYDEANAHFDRKEWLYAIGKYLEILRKDADYQNVSQKLAQAQEYEDQELDSLFQRASSYEENWKIQESLSILKQIQQRSPNYKNQDKNIKLHIIRVEGKINNHKIYLEQEQKFNKAIMILNDENKLIEARILFNEILNTQFEHPRKNKLINNVYDNIIKIDQYIRVQEQNQKMNELKKLFDKSDQLYYQNKIDDALVILMNILEVDFEHIEKTTFLADVRKKIQIFESRKQSLTTIPSARHPKIDTSKIEGSNNNLQLYRPVRTSGDFNRNISYKQSKDLYLIKPTKRFIKVSEKILVSILCFPIIISFYYSYIYYNNKKLLNEITNNVTHPTLISVPSSNTVIKSTESPEDFIIRYFDNINRKDYNSSFSMLSEDFIRLQNQKNPYSEYISFWHTIKKVSVYNIKYIESKKEFTKLSVNVLYHKEDDICIESITNFSISKNDINNSWIIDKASLLSNSEVSCP